MTQNIRHQHLLANTGECTHLHDAAQNYKTAYFFVIQISVVYDFEKP